MRKALPTILFLVVSGLIVCAPCSAQVTGGSTATSSTQNARDSELLKLLEITKIQRDAAVEKNKLYEDRLAAKDAIIEAQQGIIDVRDQQLVLAKRMDTNSLEISAVAREQISACNTQLAKADAEIQRLRFPGFWRSLFDVKTITGAAVGFGVGRLTK